MAKQQNKRSLSLRDKKQNLQSSEKYWFKAKRYGWGWYPATIEGYLVMAVYVVLMVFNAYMLGMISEAPSGNVSEFLIQVFILTVILIAICYRTGEKPGWRWGKKK